MSKKAAFDPKAENEKHCTLLKQIGRHPAYVLVSRIAMERGWGRLYPNSWGRRMEVVQAELVSREMVAC